MHITKMMTLKDHLAKDIVQVNMISLVDEMIEFSSRL